MESISVIQHLRTVDSALGVCTQFTAIKSQLTTREHQITYRRFMRLCNGPELTESVLRGSRAPTVWPSVMISGIRLSEGKQHKLLLRWFVTHL